MMAMYSPTPPHCAEEPDQQLWDWTQRLDQLGATGTADELAELLRTAPAGAAPDVIALLRQTVGMAAAPRTAAPFRGGRSQPGRAFA